MRTSSSSMAEWRLIHWRRKRRNIILILILNRVLLVLRVEVRLWQPPRNITQSQGRRLRHLHHVLFQVQWPPQIYKKKSDQRTWKFWEDDAKILRGWCFWPNTGKSLLSIFWEQWMTYVLCFGYFIPSFHPHLLLYSVGVPMNSSGMSVASF